MASVFLRGDRWFLRVKNAAGKWVKVSTSVNTKAEARRLAEDLERRYERQRHGLEQLPSDNGSATLGDLLTDWLESHSKGTPSHDWADRTIRKHLLSSDLAKLPLAAVTPEKIEALLVRKGHEELGPQSLNHLRGLISRAFGAAKRVGGWSGPNPALAVAKRRVPRRLAPDYLKADEVPKVLNWLSTRYQPLFATAIYSGLRKGELIGLKKVDVDLPNRLLTVGRSYERDTTKGGHVDVIPIAAELVPYLERALGASASELVFPAADGSMMRADIALEKVLRRAMGRAGITTGYQHSCRKRGCDHREDAPDAALRRCPVHNAKLWPKAKVRAIRFHDLRHTTASLLMMAGANPAAVQRILRHSDPRITTEVYGHLAPNYLRAEVDRLSFGATPSPHERIAEEARQVANSGQFVPLVSPIEQAGQKNEGPGSANVQNRGPISERRMGFEPTTLSLGSPSAACPAVTSLFDHGSSLRSSGPVPVQPSQRLSAITKPFVPSVSPRASLRVVSSPRGLLTIREVAERLGLSKATIYALCERGELPHTRISNSIRVSAADLDVFLTLNRKKPDHE